MLSIENGIVKITDLENIFRYFANKKACKSFYKRTVADIKVYYI